MPTTEARAEWPRTIREFSRRNAGRRTRLEIDDPELGAQWQELDFKLRGVAYEPRFRRVEIMLGDGGGPLDGLTHSIEGVSDVCVFSGGDGRDGTLRIGYPGGEAVLVLAEV
ncbi:MAG TPA: DUF5335 family protein [Longimicrobium sp.]|nr:DUF5335 family protein [Longimicrobium sp.]